jgi:hypothetical protein
MGSRWLLLVPPIEEDTFVFFFRRGESWSVRDYSNGTERVRYSDDFPPGWNPERVLEMALHRIPAETHDVRDVRYWRERIAAVNEEYLGWDWPPLVHITPIDVGEPAFPIIDRHRLEQHPKAAKPHDLERIYQSDRSEDYVTWTIARALGRLAPETWWPRLLEVADTGAPLRSDLEPEARPRLEVWRTVPAPPGYEGANRRRMADSANPVWQDRARRPQPVEGPSEIDLVVEADRFLVFVEAKLRSDLSSRTTYDPDRNQLIRMIDCVLSQAGDRAARCWMIVSDRHPARRYSQIAGIYRKDPSAAAALLPHRDPDAVAEVTSRLALIRWHEILDAVPWDRSDPVVAAALDEVGGRL